MSATHAGWMLSYASVFGMIGALSAPSFERRLHHPGVVLLICIALAGTGYVGLIAAPVSGVYLWCALIGLGQGAPLALALGYIVGRAPDSNHAAQLSMMAQSVGYLIASAGPFAMGALHGALEQLDAAAGDAARRRWCRCCSRAWRPAATSSCWRTASLRRGGWAGQRASPTGSRP